MNQKKDSVATFPTTEKDKQKVAMLKEVGTILKDVYQDPNAFYEVCAAIYSDYYEDERVLLKDLLFPEYSQLYKTDKFNSLRSAQGLFKAKFLEAFKNGNYPFLRQAFGISETPIARTTSAVPTDTSMEIFSNSNGVCIYFPYSENFNTPLTTEYFDQINTYPGYKATIVSADRESDSGPGQEPYVCSSSKTTGRYCFRAVTVNDDYAELTATHVVGVGAEPARVMGDPPPPSTNTNRIFMGWGRINNRRQYDKLISFTGNGGGSEIKVCRISGYLQFQNQQVTNFTGDEFEVSFKRKEIHNGTWKRIYGVWDPDWVPGNLEQVLAIYEEDTEGSSTFTGSVSTTVRIDSNTNITGSIGFSVTVKTQDELVLQSKYSRAAYFGAAKSDQGWGFQLCDNRKGTCRYDNTFLTSGNWPQYNGGTNWNYTWPFNSY